MVRSGKGILFTHLFRNLIWLRLCYLIQSDFQASFWGLFPFQPDSQKKERAWRNKCRRNKCSAWFSDIPYLHIWQYQPTNWVNLDTNFDISSPLDSISCFCQVVSFTSQIVNFCLYLLPHYNQPPSFSCHHLSLILPNSLLNLPPPILPYPISSFVSLFSLR